MAKPGKAAPEEEEAPAKPKGKRLLLVVLALVVLGAIGGGAWYFISGSKHEEKPKEVKPQQVVFLDLEPFTVNLQHEESDQFLQIGISLKLPSTKLEEEIKLHLPEIRSRLLFLLSSKRPSELVPVAGKKKLAHDIAVEIDSALGLRVLPGKANAGTPDLNAPEKVEAVPTAASAPVAASATAATAEQEGPSNGNGVLEVLFTSFIIQ